MKNIKTSSNVQENDGQINKIRKIFLIVLDKSINWHQQLHLNMK